MGRKKKQNQDMLSELELEIMTLIWRLKGATVAAILEQLAPDKQAAYTTISTVCRVLEKKGFVSSEARGRSHLYVAAVSKDRYESRSLDHLIEKVFDGTPTQLVARLIGESRLSQDELDEIRQILKGTET